MIVSFSGAHPFRLQCLAEVLRIEVGDENDDLALELVALIDAGRCPRCGRPITEREIASGSRMTSCRCIPVCAACGEDESWGQLGAGLHDEGCLDQWPVKPADVDARNAAAELGHDGNADEDEQRRR